MSKIANALVTDPAVLPFIAKFAVEAVKNGGGESARKSVAMAPPSPPPSGSDSSSKEEKKDRMKKSSSGKHCRRSASFALSDKGAWSMKGTFSGSVILVKNKECESYVGDIAPKMKVLHATDSQFRSVVSYNNYMLLERLEYYSGKIVTKMGKYIKRTEALIKAYKFDSQDIITILKFLAPFKRAYDSNEDSEGTVLWVMPNVTKDGPYRV